MSLVLEGEAAKFGLGAYIIMVQGQRRAGQWDYDVVTRLSRSLTAAGFEVKDAVIVYL